MAKKQKKKVKDSKPGTKNSELDSQNELQPTQSAKIRHIKTQIDETTEFLADQVKTQLEIRNNRLESMVRRSEQMEQQAAEFEEQAVVYKETSRRKKCSTTVIFVVSLVVLLILIVAVIYLIVFL